MKVITALAVFHVFVFATMPASAETYTCHAEKFCWNAAYSTPQGCQKDNRAFEVSINKRRMTLAGGGLEIVLKEARPYWQDVDWYQSGMTDTRGLINVAFDNESNEPSFSLEHMIEDSVQRKLWTLVGICEVIN
ncbi:MULTISPECIES: hypothetical protein [unclassified Ruegeria]|uniref:hypothetical protein n=1 Tax=unclassified Ruegeria TaxID=2625375 RepID=UPI001488F973|nr:MULTISPECIES: hypothetical protein [unclassified Ruegeria]